MAGELAMKTFCQICRHPSDEGIGHELNCPVYTGEPVQGNPSLQKMMVSGQQIQQAQGGLSQMGTQSMSCPHCGGHGGQHIWAGSGTCPGASTHWCEHTPYYPYGQEGPGYAQLIPHQETRDILVRLERLEEENRRLWEAMRYIPGTPMWQP